MEEFSNCIEFGIDRKMEDIKDSKYMIKDMLYIFKQFLIILNEQEDMSYLHIKKAGVVRNHLITVTYILIEKMSKTKSGYILKNFDDHCDEIITVFFKSLASEHLAIMDEYLLGLRSHIEAVIVVQLVRKYPALKIGINHLEKYHLPWLVKQLKEVNFLHKPTSEYLSYFSFYDVKVNYQVKDQVIESIHNVPSMIGLEVTLDCISKTLPKVDFIYLNLKYLFLNYPEQRIKHKKRIYKYLKRQSEPLPIHIEMPEELTEVTKVEINKQETLIKYCRMYVSEIKIMQTYLENHKVCIIINRNFNESEQKYLIKHLIPNQMEVGFSINHPGVLVQHVGKVKYKHIFFDLERIYEMLKSQNQADSDITDIYYDYIASYKSETKHYRKTVYTYLGSLSEDPKIIDFLVKRQMTNMIFRIAEIEKFNFNIKKERENTKKDVSIF